MKKQPRWLKTVIAAASGVNIPMPFERGQRKPIAIRVQAQSQTLVQTRRVAAR